jgi:hypothetical protein
MQEEKGQERVESKEQFPQFYTPDGGTSDTVPARYTGDSPVEEIGRPHGPSLLDKIQVIP